MPPLRDLPLTGRLGLTFLLLTLLGGLLAAAEHLVSHHENRDEQPGLSFADLRAAYHGIDTTAPLLAALRRGHPSGLADADRQLLLKWLRSDRISEDYDNLDLGESAPADVLDRACAACHAREAKDGGDIGQRLPFDYWDDVKKVAFSRHVEPVAPEILIASAHTHALGMGSLSVVLVLLALASRWSSRLVGALTLGLGLGLLADLGSWLPASSSAALVPVLAGAGGLWFACSVGLSLLVLAELWLPRHTGNQ